MDNFSQGSIWRKWDLHFHTPSSFDHDNKDVTNEEIAETLKAADVKLVAITDHHIIDIDKIKNLQELGNDYFTVLPGIELRSDQGSPSVHYICIFPEDCNLEDVWTKLQGNLKLTPSDISSIGGDDKVYVPISTAAKITKELGGVISIHAGTKTNSIESIRNEEQYQQRIKYDVTEKHVDFFEIGQIKDISDYIDIVFPNIGLDRPLILCSDNHDPNNYITKGHCWIKADTTFRGLKQTIREPVERVFIGEKPIIVDRVEKNKTKYINSLEIKKIKDAKFSEVWFDQKIYFNHNLVAIIGNKGSGKSALADILGLLGNSKQTDTFEFLNERKFKDLKDNKAKYFRAVLKWESGDTKTCNLNEDVEETAVETIKYIPQHHLETICNELEAGGESKFQDELLNVIFSHVPVEKRLGFHTLKELIDYRTEECKESIKLIASDLSKACLEFQKLEDLADPLYKQNLESKLLEKRRELDSHKKSKPPEVKKPASDKKDKIRIDAITTEIEVKVKRWEEFEDKISETKKEIATQSKMLADIQKLELQIKNLVDYVESFKKATNSQMKSLGLNINEVLEFSINKDKLLNIKKGAKELKDNLEPQLVEDVEDSLEWNLNKIAGEVASLRKKLDKPNKEYQLYLKAKAEWEKRKKDILGNANIPESHKGIEESIKELKKVPDRIQKAIKKQIELSLKIYNEKEKLISIYSELYGPIQKFIEEHHLAQGKFNLEFKVNISEHGFAETFLEFLSMGRKGSFYGSEEGFRVINNIVGSTDYQSKEGISDFLTNIMLHLTQDKRNKIEKEMLIKRQVKKGYSVSDFTKYIFALEYLEPRYVLRWEDKDLGQLSPGERGTLLLIFYLLVDGNDIPLIIDQPEGNLDNYTVAQVLIDCVKEAKKRRQVFLVTHNPNLAVACDAEQIVYAKLEKENNNTLTYQTGSLENPIICREVIRVLEGSKPVFDLREYKYSVGELL